MLIIFFRIFRDYLYMLVFQIVKWRTCEWWSGWLISCSIILSAPGRYAFPPKKRKNYFQDILNLKSGLSRLSWWLDTSSELDENLNFWNFWNRARSTLVEVIHWKNEACWKFSWLHTNFMQKNHVSLARQKNQVWCCKNDVPWNF